MGQLQLLLNCNYLWFSSAIVSDIFLFHKHLLSVASLIINVSNIDINL